MIYKIQTLTTFGLSSRSLRSATNYVLASIFLATLICGHALPLVSRICLGTEVRISWWVNPSRTREGSSFPVLDEVYFKGVPRGERGVVSEITVGLEREK